MITVRCTDGKIRQLSLCPPLRLPVTQSAAAAAEMIPADVIRRVLTFLSPHAEDWLAADSCCRAWREAAIPLWEGKRSQVANYYYYRQRVHKKWRRLQGFLTNARVSLYGPASDMDILALKKAVKPWKLPPVFLASLKIHDGELERPRSSGMYLGARLLSVREIIDITKIWRKLMPSTSESENQVVLTIPLFSEIGPRQVAMELRLEPQQDDDDHNIPHGRIVLVSSVAPFAPHFRVLAASWEDFLVLV